MEALIAWIIVGYIAAVCLLALLAGSCVDLGRDHEAEEEAKKREEEDEEFIAIPQWWW